MMEKKLNSLLLPFDFKVEMLLLREEEVQIAKNLSELQIQMGSSKLGPASSISEENIADEAKRIASISDKKLQLQEITAILVTLCTVCRDAQWIAGWSVEAAAAMSRLSSLLSESSSGRVEIESAKLDSGDPLDK